MRKKKTKPKRKKSVHLQAYPGVRSARLYPGKGEHVTIQVTKKYGKRTTAQEKKRAKKAKTKPTVHYRAKPPKKKRRKKRKK